MKFSLSKITQLGNFENNVVNFCDLSLGTNFAIRRVLEVKIEKDKFLASLKTRHVRDRER